MSAVASITINHQAVTMPAAFDAADHSTTGTRDITQQRAAIMAEICERLEELETLKRGDAGDTILRLAGLAKVSRRAFLITVQLMHGNLDAILASYQDQARKRNVTKQDIHYEFATELEAIRPYFPELYVVVSAMRRQAMQHEDPISRYEVAHGGQPEGDC